MFNADSTETSLTLSASQKTKSLQHQCKICGAPTDYAYFGAVSCQSCKKFFKRYAERGENAFTCDYNGQCEININTRHLCKYCRLKKCFQSGMTTDKFRPSRLTKPKTNTLVKLQRQSNQPHQIPTLNLLRSDNSLLTTDDWTHLSNICKTYQESQLTAISQHLIDTHENVLSTNNNYDTLIEDFRKCLYETTGTYLRLNADLCKLSSDDRSIVLRNAADHITCFGSAFIMDHYHLLSLKNFHDSMIMMYGKYIIDLQQWTTKFIDPDIILFKLTLSLLALSQITYLYNPNNTIYLTDSIPIYHIQSKYADITWKYLIYKYGYYEAVKRFTNITSWLLATTVLLLHCQSLAQHVNDVEHVVEQTELSLIMDDVEDIVS